MFFRSELAANCPLGLSQSLEYILSANTGETEEDVNPAPYKLRKVGDGYVLWNVTGIRMKMTSRLDGKGYDITRRKSLNSRYRYACIDRTSIVGPYEVSYGEKVYIADPAVLRIIDHAHLHPKSSQREAEVVLRFAVWPPTESNVDLSLWAGTSYFGGNPSGEPSLRFGKGSPAIRVTRDPYNPTGCEPYLHDMKLRDTVFVVDRGDCTFIDKLWNAKEAGAVGVLAINNQSDELINATADENDPQGDVADVVLLALGRSDGRTVLNLMNSVRSVGASEIVVQIEGTAPRPTFTGKDMLFVNSHPLLNTVLLR
jgi:mannosidase alpha-like ER degradation enhancer 1